MYVPLAKDLWSIRNNLKLAIDLHGGMEVSGNRGTPKSSNLVGFSHVNQLFLSNCIDGNPQKSTIFKLFLLKRYQVHPSTKTLKSKERLLASGQNIMSLVTGRQKGWQKPQPKSLAARPWNHREDDDEFTIGIYQGVAYLNRHKKKHPWRLSASIWFFFSVSDI